MKCRAIIAAMVLAIPGCASLMPDTYPELIDAEAPMVKSCASLGVISEMADANNPITTYAVWHMQHKIKARAVKLGATHIVWLHKAPQSASAQAFRCEKK
ncbi:MAG: hypothetical protein GY874_19395 [Desulfobacteraceae bacterium]|nr:hypothetical protein [Desulfobacteraceae bacterium]